MSKLAEILRNHEGTPATPATSATPDAESSRSSTSSSPLSEKSKIQGVPLGTVTCAGCLHFQERSGATPGGWCRRYRTETWGAVPFQCAAFESADPAARPLEERRAQVERELVEHPGQRVAMHVSDVSLRPGPGEPVSIVIACRTAVGIVSAEMRAPREQFDAGLFLQTLQQTMERPL